MPKTQIEKRERRKHSIRKKVSGTAERPRLTVFRSSKHMYAQVVNDDLHQTIATASTLGASIRSSARSSSYSRWAMRSTVSFTA